MSMWCNKLKPQKREEDREYPEQDKVLRPRACTDWNCNIYQPLPSMQLSVGPCKVQRAQS